MKKGFMRTLESIISILLVVGVLSWVTSSMQIYNTPEFMRTESKGIIDSIEKTVDFQKYIEEYNFKAIDSLVHYLLPRTISHKTVFSRYVLFSLKNNDVDTNRTIGITYNFPRGVGEDSIALFSENTTFPATVNWEWYEIVMSISAGSQDLSNQTVQINNLNLYANNSWISNDSLVLYFDGRIVQMENPFSHGDFSGNETNSTINITFLLDSISNFQTKTAILFYATNQTIWNSTEEEVYTELPAATNINHLVNSWSSSSRGDVFFNISLESAEERDVYMKYDINKNTGTYQSINKDSVNNVLINITYEENTLKESTSPLFTKDPTTESYASTKVLLTNNGLFKITLLTWY